MTLGKEGVVWGVSARSGLDTDLQLFTGAADVITKTGLRGGLEILCDAESGLNLLHGLCN